MKDPVLPVVAERSRMWASILGGIKKADVESLCAQGEAGNLPWRVCGCQGWHTLALRQLGPRRASWGGREEDENWGSVGGAWGGQGEQAAGRWPFQARALGLESESGGAGLQSRGLNLGTVSPGKGGGEGEAQPQLPSTEPRVLGGRLPHTCQGLRLSVVLVAALHLAGTRVSSSLGRPGQGL